jgi:osmoprotectant transport system permease protein
LIARYGEIGRRWVSYDSVAVVGCVIGLSSLLLNWFALKPNRIASGDPVGLWDAVGGGLAAIVLCLWIACLALSLKGKGRPYAALIGVAANLILVVSFILAARAASLLLEGQETFARVSLGAGFWLSFLAAYILILGARQRLADRYVLRLLITWSGLAIALSILFSGLLNDLAVLQEVVNKTDRFRQWTLNHVTLVGGSVAIGTLLAIPLGIWAERSNRAEKPIFFFSNISQTIPALALFGFLIAPLSALADKFPALEELGIRGVGLTPAMIALVVYSLLPVARNTYVALRQVDPAAIDAGLGMGMSRWKVFRRIEVALAAPIVLEGIRIAAVQAVGLATLAALIGYQTLGTPIFRGMEEGANDLVVAGAIPIIALALIMDAVMRTLTKVVTPKGVVGGVQ